MRKNKRAILCMLVYILYMITSSDKMTSIMITFAYFVCGGIFYLILGVACSSHYYIFFKRRKKILRILKEQSSLERPLIRFLNSWLKKEGFKIKLNNHGNIYLKNKIAIIQYFPTLHEKISVKPNDESSRYLMYLQDEELKSHIERYIDYINYRYAHYQSKSTDNMIYKFSSLLEHEESFSAKFSRIFFTIYGYGFLLLSLYPISSDFLSDFYKFCIICLYFIIDAS